MKFDLKDRSCIEAIMKRMETPGAGTPTSLHHLQKGGDSMADNSDGYKVDVYDSKADRRFTKVFNNYYEARKFYWKVYYSYTLTAVSINFDPNL